MDEVKERDVEVRPDIADFQRLFGNTIRQLDQNAEGIIFAHKSTEEVRLREELGAEADLFIDTNRRLEEFHRAQLEGRDMSGYGLISSTAAEIVFEASKVELQLPESYPEGTYLLVWKPKFITGYITGSNPKDVATWRFDIVYEPGTYRHPYVSVAWETDWSDWDKFKSSPAQNYPLEIITSESDNKQGEPWKMKEPEVLVMSVMKRFIQGGRLREIRSLGDAVSAAITGGSEATLNNATGYDPQEVFREAITQLNQRKGEK